MEDKIEVGEYGRTNYGKIIKFAWLEYSNGKRDRSKVILINEDTLSDDFYYFSIGEAIVKHSKDLLDLVEIGDYVNEERIIEKWDTRVGSIRSNFHEEDIETILTKEKYMANCYKVGGK